MLSDHQDATTPWRDREGAGQLYLSADGAHVQAKKQLKLDATTTITVDDHIGPVTSIRLGSARDDHNPTGHIYSIALNDGDIVAGKTVMIIDGSQLAADTDGAGPLVAETATISTAAVTKYSAHITTGAADDVVISGAAGDVIATGLGNDQIDISLGGKDTVRAGGGDDVIIAGGALTAADIVDGGDGRDTLQLSDVGLTDSVFTRVTAIEALRIVHGDGGVATLGAAAMASGIDTLALGGGTQVALAAGFTRDLSVHYLANGDAASQNVFFDGGASSAVVHFVADGPALSGALVGGTSKDDTLDLFAAPQDANNFYNLFYMGVEHIVIHNPADGSSGNFAAVSLGANADLVQSKTVTVDASELDAGNSLHLNAATSTAKLAVTGGEGGDILVGGGADDVIHGGNGGDILAGIDGINRFTYTAVAESSGASIDTIVYFDPKHDYQPTRDFVSGTDVIDVARLDKGNPELDGELIAFFGNQTGGGHGQDAAFAQTAGNGVVDAVFRSDSHTLWFDTNDDGVLNSGDLQIVLFGVNKLVGADLLDGHMIG